MIIKELCIGSIEDVQSKLDKLNDFDRFETCSNLSVGGLTPTVEIFNFIRSKTNKPQVIMIRNKDTFYLEDKKDLDEMLKQIETFANLGAKHFIFGYLTKDNKIDITTMNKLINKVIEFENTTYSFHMVIDLTTDYFESLNTLVDLGFERVLLKGGQNAAINNIKTLKELNNTFKDKIQLLVGGKVNKDNYKQIIELTGINQVHGREIV